MGNLVKKLTDATGLTDSGAIEDYYKNATRQQRAILARLDAVDLPDIQKMKLALEIPELQGLLEVEEIGPTALEEITTDPIFDSGIMQALSGLRDRAEEGLTAEDKFLQEQMLSQAAAQDAAQRKAIDQEMARRGVSDSGFAMAQKLQAQQSGANQARNEALQLAAQSQQNRMQALQNLGQMSSQQQASRFGQQSQIASAKDAIAAANARNRQNVSAQNLAARQNIENQRVNLLNQQQIANKQLQQQQFQNEMAKAGAQGQAQQGIAQQYQQQAAAQAAADAATTGALFELGTTAATGGFSSPKKTTKGVS